MGSSAESFYNDREMYYNVNYKDKKCRMCNPNGSYDNYAMYTLLEGFCCKHCVLEYEKIKSLEKEIKNGIPS